MEKGMICTGNFFLVVSVNQLKFLAYHMALERKGNGSVRVYLSYEYIRHVLILDFAFCSLIDLDSLYVSLLISNIFNQPWGNVPKQNPRYKQYLDENRLHCGDETDVNFLMEVWKNEMKVPGAPPLKIVVDDASHEAAHMAQTVLFWLPRIEPGGDPVCRGHTTKRCGQSLGDTILASDYERFALLWQQR